MKRDWRISSCPTRVYTDDFSSYKMCGNSGCKLDVVETLFFAYLENVELSLEKYIEQIRNLEVSKEDLQKTKDAKKQTKLMQVDKLKKRRKKIRTLIEEEFYEDAEEESEKRQEVKDLYKTIKELEEEIDEMDRQEEESETVQVDRILRNIKNFLQGKHLTMDKKEQNEILHEIVDHIKYSKNGRSAEVEIKVQLKEEVKEIMDVIGVQ